MFFALFFGILSAAQASSYLPNYAKARLSAKRIFALEDLVPAIDSYSKEGEKPVSVLHMYAFLAHESTAKKYLDIWFPHVRHVHKFVVSLQW